MAEEASIWCVVANVAAETRHGHAAAEARPGTKHFVPGTKVYCFPLLWGDGYLNVKVLGRHRGARGLAEMVIEFRHLDDWRAKVVYKPDVIARMAGHWDGSAASKAKAEEIVAWGRLARSCPICQLELGNVDTSASWFQRAWPAMAVCRDPAGPTIRIDIYSRVHVVGANGPRPSLVDDLAAMTAHAERVLEARAAVSPIGERDGHLHATVTITTAVADPLRALRDYSAT